MKQQQTSESIYFLVLNKSIDTDVNSTIFLELCFLFKIIIRFEQGEKRSDWAFCSLGLA